jgi:hypothetical protein
VELKKMDLNIKYVKEGIKKVAGKHFIKEEGDNIKNYSYRSIKSVWNNISNKKTIES